MLYLFYLLLYYFCSYWLQNRKKGRSPYGLRPYILLYAVRLLKLLNQYMPPMSPPAGVAGAGGSGRSATRLSVVRTIAATLEAFSRAERVTLVGSTMPASIISSTYSSFWAS